jgi:hypothetical protein
MVLIRAASRPTVVISCLTLVMALVPSLRAQPYPNVQVNVQSNSPEETAIAANPRNLSNLVGVAQSALCHFYNSFDNGSTWTEGGLSDPRCLGDPSVVCDDSNHFYYGFIGTFTHSGIFVDRSTDGGRTWQAMATAVIEHNSGVPFEDKGYPCCDNTQGPRRGNLYIGWTQFDHYGSSNPSDSTRILFSRSTDFGVTFSTPIRISDHGGNAVDADSTVEGAIPAVGPEGTVYISWAGPRGIEFDRSTDGGATFGTDRVISDIPGGWDFAVAGIYRANGLPTTKADISSGPYRGRVYVNWSDQRNGDTDVFLLYSDDGGDTWGPRVRVNDDPVGNGKEQFFPWIDVDPITGTVYVVFYDRREETGVATDVYLATSTDGGAHFANQKISATPFSPVATVFFGDYIGLSAFGGWVRPLWVRLDGNVLSLWTALINPNPNGVVDWQASPEKLRVLPNPVSASAGIFCAAGFARVPDIEIVDWAGRILRRIGTGPGTAGPGDRLVTWDGLDGDGRRVPSGVYFVRADDRAPARMVVVR